MQSQEKKEVRQRRKQFVDQFYKGNRVALIIFTVLVTLESLTNVVYAEIERLFMDFFTGDGKASFTWTLAATILVVAGYGVVQFGKGIVEPAFQRRAMNQYREYAFQKLTEKSIGTFSHENTARYLSMLTNDAKEVKEKYLDSVPRLFGCGVCFVLALISSLRYSPLLTVIALVASALPLLLAPAQGRVMGKWEKQVSDRNESYVGGLKDWLSGFPLVKSFRAEKAAILAFKQENDKLEQEKYERSKRDGLFWIASAFLIYASLASLYAVGAVMIWKGTGLTVGTLLAVCVLRNAFSDVMQSLPYIWANRKSAIALIDKQVELLQENVRAEGEKIPAKLEEGISFEKVSFAYEEGKPVLSEITQKFEAGKSYAIVGASGSGKSTMLNLLMGSADSYAGDICFDGKELRQIHEDSLFELMTSVQQNVFVFNDTIRNNITMFQTFPDEEVNRAIHLSGLEKLLTERGEAYICGENGNGLSGGERQRISIARAILRGAPIMLVDEATAALDAETAFAVTNAILDIDDMTRIVVTHRLEAALLTRYDEILVMQNGRLCETGTFAKLMEQKGLFYSLFMIALSSEAA